MGTDKPIPRITNLRQHKS